MRKLILLTLVFIVSIQIAFAGVSRTIGNFNCPSRTTVNFQLSGATTFYGVYEYIPNTWSIVSTNPTAGVAAYGADNQLQFGVPSSGSSASYTVGIPNANNYDSAYNNNPHTITKGEYSIDGGAITAVSGSTSINVRRNSCDPGASGNHLGFYDDQDSDGCGMGCACPCTDCVDTDPNINPRHAEVWCNTIDDNCDGKECCSPIQYTVVDPRHYDGDDTVWTSASSNWHVCNGLDNTEKRYFMTEWLNARISPTLDVVGNNVPTDYNNW